MAVLTKAKYEQRKRIFLQTVLKNPVEVNLYIHYVEEAGTNFEQFTGDQERQSGFYTVKGLYTREFSPIQRAKYGYEEDVSGVIFIPPELLVEEIGFWQLDVKTLSARVAGIRYAVNRVIFKAPLFDTCLAVEIRLTTPLKF